MSKDLADGLLFLTEASLEYPSKNLGLIRRLERMIKIFRKKQPQTSEIMGLFYELYDKDFQQLPTWEQVTKFFIEMDKAIINKQTELATDYTGLLYALLERLLKKEAGK